MIEFYNRYKKIAWSVLIIIGAPLLVESYFLIIEAVISPNDLFKSDFYHSFFVLIRLKRLIILFLLAVLGTGLFNRFGKETIFRYLYQYRYRLGALFLFGCVLFEIHGSSVYYWENYFQGSKHFETLIGISRSIRSDEWAVNTPMMISQYFNGAAPFPYFSETIRGALTDAFIIYGQPVLNIVEIFRPFHWGYLLLSPAKGLSFFWIGRILGLFFVSFELAMMLGKENKRLAVIYGLLVTWAPIVQWWFAVNGLVEMLILGQLAMIMVDRYFKTRRYGLRFLYALIFLICAGGYVLTFYPAWQIPLAYVFLALLIGIVYENRENIALNRKDLAIIAGLTLAFVCAMGYILVMSYDTILLVMDTVYPGARFETGGGQLYRYFLYPGNLFFVTSRELSYANTCELATFFDFFPAGIILALWVLVIEKKRDPYLILFSISFFILSAFCLVSWPHWLASISLLSHAQPSRVFLAIGFLNLLLLIRALTLIETAFPKWVKGGVAIVTALVISVGSMIAYQGYLDVKMFVLVLLILTFVFYLILSWRKIKMQEIMLGITILIVFVSGMFINPIVNGLDVILDQPLIKMIKETADTSDALWIVDSEAGAGYPLNNLPIMAGAATINSTNVYPNLDRWRLLDPDRSEEEVYNRYAHITINLSNRDEETRFILDSADLITIRLNTRDLEKLEVGYVLSQRDLSDFSNEDVSFIPLKNANGFTIYQLNYAIN